MPTNFFEFGREDLFLTLPREAARHAPPEDIFLAPDSFARKIETMVAEPPEAVDAKVVGGGPEAGAQQESGENEPGLLVVRRLLAPGHTAFQSWPERADEGRVPFALRHSQNLLQVSKEPCRCERLSLPRGGGKPGPNARPGGFQCVRRDIRLPDYA